MRNKYSPNNKLNALLCKIEQQLRDFGLSEVKRYMEEAGFNKEPDYNIVQYGNLLIYYQDVRELFANCGYITANYSDYQLWNSYRFSVGYVARQLRKEGL